MKRAINLALVALAGLTVPGAAFAHGGQYRGPGDTVPPGGSGGSGGGAGPATGPAQPGTGGPTSPVGPGPGVPGQPGTGNTGSFTPGPSVTADLSQWSFWWEFNKDPYLQLKAKIWGGGAQTGTPGFWIGRGVQDDAVVSERPSQTQIRQVVVPALLDALENETSNDIVTGCLIALAKIGDANTESGESEFEQVIARFLPDSNQEISETAGVSLGILGNPASIKTLQHLVEDTAAGRALVGRHEVPYRTRSFAAYGLGLIGARGASGEERRYIVRVLRQTLESDASSTRDIQVACVIALGLVPLDASGGGLPDPEADPLPPEKSLEAELDYLVRFLGNEEHRYLVRAHCPTSLARLVTALPDDQVEAYRGQVARALLERIGPKARERNEVVQSCVLALGQLGTNDGENELDREIRAGLFEASADSDQQVQRFALIAAAKVAARRGENDPDAGLAEVRSFLLKRLGDKDDTKAWAALSLGVLSFELGQNQVDPAADSVRSAVRTALEKEKNAERLGALALASGLLRDIEAQALLLRHFERESDDVARGYVALGLGILGDGAALEPIQRVIELSKYRAELLRQAAVALGLLGDKTLVPRLVGMLEESRALASQAALASALGFIGDRNSIDPLVRMLENRELTDRARGFAAVALGVVADKEPLPWNSKIAVDLNYRAATSTLTDPTGVGILDIL